MLSNDIFNKNSELVIGVPITRKFKKQFEKFRLKIPAHEGGLDFDSYAVPDQIRTISVSRLGPRLGKVSPRIVTGVIDRIKVLLVA